MAKWTSQSLDNDPLFLYQQWQANLRFLGVDEIKTVPYTPISHPFIERLIETIRREYLDHILFWNVQDLERKLADFRQYHNRDRVHQSLGRNTLAVVCGDPLPLRAKLSNHSWASHCNGLFLTQVAAWKRIRLGQAGGNIVRGSILVQSAEQITPVLIGRITKWHSISCAVGCV